MTTTYGMLQSAYKGHYAVPAINTQGGIYDVTRAVCMAAEELRSPVILVHYANTGAYPGHDWFYKAAKWMTAKVSVPITVYLDHGDNFERCMEMLKLGSASIMSDGSALPVEKNTVAIETVARTCRSPGAPLEAEIGELCCLNDKGNKTGASNTVDPDVVRQYPKLCYPDSLAIDIDNAHGSYNEPVDIRTKVSEECEKFTDILSVLHGCMGMDEELVRRSIDSGVIRTNFGTQVRYQYTDCLKEELAGGKDQGHAWRLSQYAELRLREDIKDIIRLAGSQEKA